MSLWGARCGKPARRVLRGEGGTRGGPRPPSTQLKLGSVVWDILGKSGRAILTAIAAGHTKNTYLSATYRRIAARRGKKRAAIAVGRNILEIAYFVLRDGVGYEELGVNYYDERKKLRWSVTRSKRLEQLGYRVAIEPAA